jgi:ADP-dependent NAD(P)H-hydrate dehydratase / NAD(P)H-hydrate epimerase
MRAIRSTCTEPLYSVASTRAIEQYAAAQLPPHQLMTRAGLCVAQLARALAPHARCIWIACGPGNNGGDGLVAATHLHHWAQAIGRTAQVVVTHWQGMPTQDRPIAPDALHALGLARSAGVHFASQPPEHFDLAIDAVYGIGLTRPPPQGSMEHWLGLLHNTQQTVLCVDVPSGLDADTGNWVSTDLKRQHATGNRHTLALLTLKPGLLTADGRDAAGQVWFDDLQVEPSAHARPSARLNGWATPAQAPMKQPHASHKGSFGDVVVVGGQDLAVNGSGMTGAAVLAARAALHAGAGRVYVGLLGAQTPTAASAVHWDPASPELMFRDVHTLIESPLLVSAAVVCGCGGGSAVATILRTVLSRAHTLVLDADALNAVTENAALQALLSERSNRGWFTVLTPHPLEAAKLLGSSTAQVMANRLEAAQALSERFNVVCVLKGSGTVISAPGQTPLINPTGNSTLATAGTGDVLAGMLGSALAQPNWMPEQRHQRLAQAVFQHGWLADEWQADAGLSGFETGCRSAMTAGRLADWVRPLR